MDEWISKKELLELTNISYGQLYRWKRKNIIPEEWFVKRSVPSGQETFFPREKILERIDAIINMKDEASLDELANMFSSKVEQVTLDLAKLSKSRLLSEESVLLYKQAVGSSEIKVIEDIIGVKLFKDLVLSSQITLEEGKLLDGFIKQNFAKLNGEKARVLLIRHMGMPLVLGIQDREQLLLDTHYKVICERNLYEEVSTIKFQMMT